jgi:hypothetical protein
MATNSPGSTARQDPRNVTNTIRALINFGDSGLSAGVQIGVLPQGAFILGWLFEVVTAFNAGTTNPVSVGSNAAAYTNIMAAADNTPGTPGIYQDPVVAGPPSTRVRAGRSIASAGDTPILIKYAPTGTAATTGQGVFVLEFEGGFVG